MLNLVILYQKKNTNTNPNKSIVKITFMGTGTSLGVPIIGCGCNVCQSADPRDKRTRSSLMLEAGHRHIMIDTGPDFRTQCLSNSVTRIDAVLITHPHRDHLAGLDDIRPFCYQQQAVIPIYGSSLSCDAIRRDYAYCFAEPKYPGVPDIELHEIEYGKEFRIGDTGIVPLPVMHGSMKVTAYRIGDFTYITDANMISDHTLDMIAGTRYLVINALSPKKHHSHFSLEEALSMIERINPEWAYLTHIGHSLGHEETERNTPDRVHLAYDGLQLEF